MVMRFQEEFDRVVIEVENARRQIYSENIGKLSEMAKSLYKEFQEQLIETEEVTLNHLLVYTNQTRPSKWTKNGMELIDGKTISVEEYIDRILVENSDNRYIYLLLLKNQIGKLEETYHKKLTGKYLKEETKKQESSNAETSDG